MTIKDLIPWNSDQGYLGRPADIVQAKDGSVLVADDWLARYRISYSKKVALMLRLL
jgi:glucose/arabinose dehydrogenase